MSMRGHSSNVGLQTSLMEMLQQHKYDLRLSIVILFVFTVSVYFEDSKILVIFLTYRRTDILQRLGL